jgi:hypothetical protein
MSSSPSSQQWTRAPILFQKTAIRLARKAISERMISWSRRVMDLTSGFDFLSVDGLNAEFALSHFSLLPSSGAVH